MGILIVPVAPKSVRVLGNDGISIKNHTVLEPKDEGTEVDLICEAIGGKPIPKVTWYNGTTEITRGKFYFIPLCTIFFYYLDST